MVKELDDEDPFVLQHIGVDLWQAAVAWRSRLHAEMVERGHAWYGDARGTVAAHLDPRGLTQSALVARMGMTKQAVQQLLDGLDVDGVVRREPDPADGRGKRVVYTAKGRAALLDAATIERRIEGDIRRQLGDAAFASLRASLRNVAVAVVSDLRPKGGGEDDARRDDRAGAEVVGRVVDLHRQGLGVGRGDTLGADDDRAPVRHP